MLPKIRTKTPNLMQKNEVRRVVSPSLMPTEGKLSFELQRESWGQGSSPCRSRAGLSPWLRPPKGRESPHALGGRASYRVGRAGPPASPLPTGAPPPVWEAWAGPPVSPLPTGAPPPVWEAWAGPPVSPLPTGAPPPVWEGLDWLASPFPTAQGEQSAAPPPWPCGFCRPEEASKATRGKRCK
jgi:hypothetical protein